MLAGCAATGENLQANVYKAGQVNSAQKAEAIDILSVMPAKIEVDNTEQKQQAQVLGGILGAVGGGVLGSNVAPRGDRASGTAIGAVGGGLGGAAAGSLVSDKILVDGVSLSYERKGDIYNSAQVGKLCEFKTGRSLLISTSPTETRIQPNSVCQKTK
jgi:outer membrane lipoprotein SlyB